MASNWKIAVGITCGLITGASTGYLIGRGIGHREMYQAVKHSLGKGERNLGELLMQSAPGRDPEFEQISLRYVNQHWMRSPPDYFLMEYSQRNE